MGRLGAQQATSRACEAELEHCKGGLHAGTDMPGYTGEQQQQQEHAV